MVSGCSRGSGQQFQFPQLVLAWRVPNSGILRVSILLAVLSTAPDLSGRVSAAVTASEVAADPAGDRAQGGRL